MKVMYFVVRSKKLEMNMHYCRKVFASWLSHHHNIPDFVIDILQGRVPQSILVRHYLVPQEGLKDQMLQALEKLKRAIEQQQ